MRITGSYNNRGVSPVTKVTEAQEHKPTGQESIEDPDHNTAIVRQCVDKAGSQPMRQDVEAFQKALREAAERAEPAVASNGALDQINSSAWDDLVEQDRAARKRIGFQQRRENSGSDPSF